MTGKGDVSEGLEDASNNVRSDFSKELKIHSSWENGRGADFARTLGKTGGNGRMLASSRSEDSRGPTRGKVTTCEGGEKKTAKGESERQVISIHAATKRWGLITPNGDVGGRIPSQKR